MAQQEMYDIINRDRQGDGVSRIYDWFMLVMIMASITPLMFIDDCPVFKIIGVIHIIALPSGVITASYLEKLKEYRKNKSE